MSSPSTADDHDDRTQRRGLFKGVNSRGRRGWERCDGLSSGQEDRLGGGRQSSTIQELQIASGFKLSHDAQHKFTVFQTKSCACQLSYGAFLAG